MGEIIIKEATKEDAELIARLSRQTFHDTFAPHNTPQNMEIFMNTYFSMERLTAQVGAQGNFFFIAYNHDEPAGYVRMCESKPPAALQGIPAIEIARIYSEQQSIGKGVGSALMQHCIDTAMRLGKKAIWLGVWERNDRAIAFYTKWGFEKCGTHDFILGKDVQQDWLMYKKL